MRGVEGRSGVFTSPAAVPALPWIDRPTRGFIAGLAKDREGMPLDGATVRIKRTGWFRRTARVTTDGNGWFGISQRSPGRYVIRLESAQGSSGTPVTVEVRAGAVTLLDSPLIGSR